MILKPLSVMITVQRPSEGDFCGSVIALTTLHGQKDSDYKSSRCSVYLLSKQIHQPWFLFRKYADERETKVLYLKNVATRQD